MEERKKAIQNLKIAKGQIEGIIKMIEDERYCIDISNQLLATIAILKKANKEIISSHMKHCVLDASDEDASIKIDEMIQIINQMMK